MSVKTHIGDSGAIDRETSQTPPTSELVNVTLPGLRLRAPAASPSIDAQTVPAKLIDAWSRWAESHLS
jgi:hypothetical protein